MGTATVVAPTEGDVGIHSLHGANAARRQATQELLFFASVGDLARCKTILQTWNLDVNDSACCDYDRRTPLHLAAAEGCYSVVQWIVEEKRASPNFIDRFKRTPLEDAVRGDHGEVAQLLVANGARVLNKAGELVDLQASDLARYVRMFEGEEGDEQLQPEWEIDPSDIKLGVKVGGGEFGTVHQAKWYDTTVAVKVLRRSDAVAVGDFRTELNVLQKVHHPHTVQFLGACTQAQPYMILTEFIPGGSLADMFKRARTNPKFFPDIPRAAHMALDCAKGMLYLHARGKHVVIHRDLKPANLLLGGIPYEGGDRDMALKHGVIKIADFGLSKTLALNIVKRQEEAHAAASLPAGVAKQSAGYKLTGETGSYRYMAPEVFRHEPYNNKVDVYAFAMICYELFEGHCPFYALHPIEAARLAAMEHRRPKWGMQNRFGKVVPPQLRELVERCWAPEYDNRPDFAEICSALEVHLAKLPANHDGGECACSLQ